MWREGMEVGGGSLAGAEPNWSYYCERVAIAAIYQMRPRSQPRDDFQETLENKRFRLTCEK